MAFQGIVKLVARIRNNRPKKVPHPLKLDNENVLLKFTSGQKQNCRQHPTLCEIQIPVLTPVAFEPPAFKNATLF